MTLSQHFYKCNCGQKQMSFNKQIFFFRDTFLPSFQALSLQSPLSGVGETGNEEALGSRIISPNRLHSYCIGITATNMGGDDVS
jgi:hypothetical protein